MGGDGFYSRVDPKDPNTIYANMQNGDMVRFDRRTGERVSIQPQPAKGDPAMRWNWDTPVIISPHSNTRLYFGAQRLYRSDDRGDSWRPVSPDLTRNLDRNKLPLMGKVWSIDAIQKNVSTALYDNISAIAESPKQEGLIYVGTDDGLVQVTEDGGKTWHKVEKAAGVPEDAYVQRILASQHDAATVYVAYENHQNGDFKPYLIKSTDKGKTWSNISGNLPERGGVYAIAEDYVNPKLLFAGTEFGLYFTNIGGEKWTKLNIGLPTIMVRDLAIQKQMDDLVIATFGRGIYVLDDYSPIRVATPEMLQKESALFPVRTALSYIPANSTRGELGADFFTAPNPPVGAEITFHLSKGLMTKRQERLQAERAAMARGETPAYPTADELRAEAAEEAPAIVVSIADSTGKVVRRFDAPATRGIHRVTWDLRDQGTALPPAPPTAGGAGGRGGRGGAGRGGAGGGEEEPAFFGRGAGAGALAVPGKYTVALAKRQNGAITPLAGSQSFEVVGEGPATREDRVAMAEFQEKLARLQKAMTATNETATEAHTRLEAIRRAVDATPSLPPKVREDTLRLEKDLADIELALNGDRVWRVAQRGRSGLDPGACAGRGVPDARHHGPSDQDRDRAVSDRIGRPRAPDSEAAEAGGDRYQSPRQAARCRRSAAHAGPPAGLERREVADRSIQFPAQAVAAAAILAAGLGFGREETPQQRAGEADGALPRAFRIRRGRVPDDPALCVRSFGAALHRNRGSDRPPDPVRHRGHVREAAVRERPAQSDLQFPAFAEYRLDVLIGFGVVGDPEILRVPFELAGETQRDSGQRQPLGVRGRDPEIGAARVAALAGANPVEHVAGRARQQLRRQNVLGPAGGGQQPHAFAAVAGGHDAFGADEDRAVAGEDARLRRCLRVAEHAHAGAAGALTGSIAPDAADGLRGRRRYRRERGPWDGLYRRDCREAAGWSRSPFPERGRHRDRWSGRNRGRRPSPAGISPRAGKSSRTVPRLG